MQHDATTLRGLLEEIARLLVPSNLTSPDAAKLSEAFRDCRLELTRLQAIVLSDDQSHRLRQMGFRLEMVVSGHAEADTIQSEAQRALESFGWN